MRIITDTTWLCIGEIYPEHDGIPFLFAYIEIKSNTEVKLSQEPSTKAF